MVGQAGNLFKNRGISAVVAHYHVQHPHLRLNLISHLITGIGCYYMN